MGSTRCDSSAPCRPTTFHLSILSLQHIVRSRLPNCSPIHVWNLFCSAGIDPSPVNIIQSFFTTCAQSLSSLMMKTFSGNNINSLILINQLILPLVLLLLSPSLWNQHFLVLSKNYAVMFACFGRTQLTGLLVATFTKLTIQRWQLLTMLKITFTCHTEWTKKSR